MGYRLTLPGGVVVDADTVHEAAELYIKLTPAIEGLVAQAALSPAPGVEAAPPSKWKPNRPNGRGSIETSGKYGFRWSVMIEAKRHVGPTFGSEAEAEASLAEFLRTGVMPPKPPRAAYRCGNCFGSGHTVKRCPQRPARAAGLPTERQAASSGFGPSGEAAKQEQPPENEVPAREDQHEIIGETGAPGADGARGETIDESGDGSEKSSGFPCAQAPVALAGRARRSCKRCGQPGHNASTCDVDLTEARVQAIVAACVRLGLAAPPAPRVLPVLASVPDLVRPPWDRSDPEQDLTDLDLGVPEPAAPPPAPAGPTLVVAPPPVRVVVFPDDAPTPPALERARQRLSARAGHEGPRSGSRTSVTISGPMFADERDAGKLLETPANEVRPQTRGECGEARPCPFVSCQYHLYLDVNESGNLVLNHPAIDVWDMGEESCALDAADAGEHTLDAVAGLMGGMVRERVRQLEESGLAKIKKHSGDELGLPPESGEGFSSHARGRS